MNLDTSINNAEMCGKMKCKMDTSDEMAGTRVVNELAPTRRLCAVRRLVRRRHCLYTFFLKPPSHKTMSERAKHVYTTHASLASSE